MEILIALAAFMIAGTLVWRFSRPNSWLRLLNHLNERSLHNQPTPCSGGLAILIVVYFCSAVVLTLLGRWDSNLLLLAAAGLLVVAVSFIDDRFTVPAAYRLAVHFAAAAMLVYAGFSLEQIELPSLVWVMPPLVSGVVTLLYVAWMINLYNFMDGIDGLAAGMTVIGFSALALLGLLAGHQLYALLCLVVASSTAGFLVFNFPPARIFMGDTGSTALGLLASGFSLWGAQERIFPLWMALLVFSPFIVDATVTLIRRALRRERVWLAHRDHYYQRLVLSGWGHRKVVLCEYLVMFGAGASAVAARTMQVLEQWLMLVAWTLIYAALVRFARRNERNIRSKVSEE